MKANNRIDRDAYRDLHRTVLERDGWTCQFCGARTGLEVHHIGFRSHGGEDGGKNLITLCTRGHRQVHGRHELLPGGY